MNDLILKNEIETMVQDILFKKNNGYPSMAVGKLADELVKVFNKKLYAKRYFKKKNWYLGLDKNDRITLFAGNSGLPLHQAVKTTSDTIKISTQMNEWLEIQALAGKGKRDKISEAFSKKLSLLIKVRRNQVAETFQQENEIDDVQQQN